MTANIPRELWISCLNFVTYTLTKQQQGSGLNSCHHPRRDDPFPKMVWVSDNSTQLVSPFFHILRTFRKIKHCNLSTTNTVLSTSSYVPNIKIVSLRLLLVKGFQSVGSWNISLMIPLYISHVLCLHTIHSLPLAPIVLSFFVVTDPARAWVKLIIVATWPPLQVHQMSCCRLPIRNVR